MGLDGVEIVLAIEREFKITLSDEVVAQMETVGDVQRWLVRYFRSGSQVSTFTEGARSDEEIWDRLREVVADQFGVSPDAVKEETFLDGG